MKERGGYYIGSDISPRTGASVVVEPSGSLPFASDSIDGVMHTCVLEHTEQPGTFLTEIRRVLRPGAWMVFVTHGAFPYHGTPGRYGDFWRWTHEGLRLLLSSGWEVLGVYPTENDWSSLIGLLIFRIRACASVILFPLVGLLILVLNMLGHIVQRMGHRHFQWFPSCYVVVARKCRMVKSP